MTLPVTTITVHYERKLSDGNYGSEGLSMSMTCTADVDGVPGQLQDLHETLRALVLEELSQSQAERVAWAAKRELSPPPPQPVAAGASEDLEDIPF